LLLFSGAVRFDTSAIRSDIAVMAHTSKDVSDPAVRTANAMPREAPFGAPHVFALLVVDGDDPHATHRIARQETTIGRGEESDFTIEDAQISRAHCRLRVEGSVCTIADLGSRNGTSVNGRALVANVSQRLRHLDEIEIGSHRLILLTGRFRPQAAKG
jgi:pSer/pThr/pTyr-binding forkhead associated (FHA) protein